MKPAVQRKDRDRFLSALFFLALFIFMVTAVFVYVYPDNSLDRYVQDQTHTLASPALLLFWIRLTFFGSFEFLFPAYLIFILINVWRRKVRFGLSVAIVAIGGFLSVQILKQVIQRYRPATPLIPSVIDYSFPSGHSTSSCIFCAVLTWSLWHSKVSQSLRFTGMILLTLLACFIGLSRIVLTVHYATDVAAGFCLGIVWTIGWYRFVHKKT